MESLKIKNYTVLNNTVLTQLEATPNIRKVCVEQVALVAETEEMEQDFINNPIATNIYQHTWRRAYAKMKSKVGFCPYEALNIEEGKSIKIGVLENMGFLPALLLTVSSL